MKTNAKFTYMHKIILLIIILIMSSNCLKHGKSEDKKKQATVQTSVTTEENKKVEEGVKNKKQSKNDENLKKEEKQDKKVNEKPLLQFTIQSKQNQYVIPVLVGSDTFHLGVIYDEKQSKYGSIPSWFFTSLVDQDHQLCDAKDDCQQVSKFIKCKDNGNCVDGGKAKFSSQIMQSKRKAKIKFTNNNHNFQMSFVSPKKVTLSQSIVGENQIEGMLNLALNEQQKYSNEIIVINNSIKIVSSPELQKQLQNKQILQLTKTGLLSFSSSKDIYIHTLHHKDKKVTNNLKESYEKFKIKFSNSNLTMAVPKNTLAAIKNILKKEYFGDRCKISGDGIICSAAPVKNITKISFCRESSGERCLSLPVLGYIIKEVTKDRSYKLLIEENEQKNGKNTFILYPKIASIYKIYGQKGIVKGLLHIGQVKEESVSKNQGSSSKAKTDEQQTQQQQKQEEKEASKEDAKVQEKKQQKKQQKSQQQKQSSEQQQQQKPKKKQQSKNSKKPKKQQQHEQEETSQEQQTQEEAKPKKKQTKKANQKHTNANDGMIEEQKKYSKGVFFFVLVYGLVFIIILIVIKMKASESIAAQAIDRFIDLTWYGIVKNYFNKSQGYKAPKLEEEVGGGEDVDHSDSVAVGYTQKQGRDLFWQKNSVEGI